MLRKVAVVVHIDRSLAASRVRAQDHQPSFDGRPGGNTSRCSLPTIWRAVTPRKSRSEKGRSIHRQAIEGRGASAGRRKGLLSAG